MQRRRSRAPREPAHHDRACQHGTLFTSKERELYARLNLTRNEATERASIIKRVHSYRIELDLPKDKDVFSSKVEIRFDAQEGASTFIDAITSSVKSINLNGEELSTDLAAASASSCRPGG